MYLYDIEEKRSLVTAKLDIYLIFVDGDKETKVIATDVYPKDYKREKNNLAMILGSGMNTDWFYDPDTSTLHVIGFMDIGDITEVVLAVEDVLPMRRYR